MSKLITNIKKLEINKLMDFLNENPSKKEILKSLNAEKLKINKQVLKLKKPEKKYSNFDRLLSTQKYKDYQKEVKNYDDKKRELNTIVIDYENKIKIIETDQEYDNNREKVIKLIPLIENSKSIEEIALYTFYETLDVKSSLKSLIAIILLLQSIEIIKKDSDIEKVYDGLDIELINKKLDEVSLESLIKTLGKNKIDIDDGFYQFIIMILSDNSSCNQKNLNASFPILRQLKKDKEVPKNIRVAIDILDDAKNENRTIHEVGCEILLKEIFYKIKENSNV